MLYVPPVILPLFRIGSQHHPPALPVTAQAISWRKTNGSKAIGRPRSFFGPTPTIRRQRLYLQHFFLFGRATLVNLGHIAVGQLLDVLAGFTMLIFRDGLVFFRFFQGVVGLAANIAQSDFGVLAVFFGQLDQFLAPFFGKRRDNNTDDFAVINRVLIPTFSSAS